MHSSTLADLLHCLAWMRSHSTKKCQGKVKNIKIFVAKLITRDLNASVLTKVKVLYLKDKKDQWFTDSSPDYTCNWMDTLLISD